MGNNKGQALVEFIVIIPVFMFLAMGIVDFGNILYQKYELENEVDVVTDMYKQSKLNEISNYLASKNILVSYTTNGDLETINLSKSINVITPGLNLILGDSYLVEVDRVVYNEQ